MSRDGEPRRDPSDPTVFERRLDAAVRRRVGEPGDDELRQLLRHIGRRRARRVGPTGAVASAPGGGTGDGVTTPSAGGGAGELLSVERVGDSVRILRVGRPPGFRFEAGQYARVGVGDGKGRKFSIASAPHDPDLEFCVEVRPGGRVTPRLFALTPGDEVTVSDQARGSFGLDTSIRRHLMIATVTGIAPMRSMWRDALHRDLAEEVVVLHGASFADELAYRNELETLAADEPRIRYEPTVSRPDDPRNTGWTGHRGRVDALASSLAAGFDPRTTRVYAAGNAGMVRNVADSLGAMGFEVLTEAY